MYEVIYIFSFDFLRISFLSISACSLVISPTTKISNVFDVKSTILFISDLLSEANRRMFVGDYKVLIKANKEKGLNIDKQELYEVDRLISLGLLQNENRLGGVVSILLGEESNNGKDVIVTSFGRSFCQHMPYSM